MRLCVQAKEQNLSFPFYTHSFDLLFAEHKNSIVYENGEFSMPAQYIMYVSLVFLSICVCVYV